MSMSLDDAARSLAEEAEGLIEALRLQEVKKIMDRLEATPDATFLDVASLAAHICAAPVAAVTLVDEIACHLIGFTGSGDRWDSSSFKQADRNVVACNLTIKTPDQPCIIYDAETDDRTIGLPFFNGTYDYIKFYYGLALTTKSGNAVGTICVLDRMPRTLRKDQIAALERLRRLVLKLYGD